MIKKISLIFGSLVLSSLIYLGNDSTSAVKADTMPYTVVSIDKYPELRYLDPVGFGLSHPDIMHNKKGVDKASIQKFNAIGYSGGSEGVSVFRSIDPGVDDTGYLRTIPKGAKFQIYDLAVQSGTVFYRIGSHQWVVSGLTHVNDSDIKYVGDLIVFNSYEDSIDGMKKFLNEDIS